MTKDRSQEEQGTEEVSLESRLERLEVILGKLEAGEVELEQALALFEEGVGHVRQAEGILSRTELKVEELLAGGETAPFDEEDAG